MVNVLIAVLFFGFNVDLEYKIQPQFVELESFVVYSFNKVVAVFDAVFVSTIIVSRVDIVEGELLYVSVIKNHFNKELPAIGLWASTYDTRPYITEVQND